MRATAALLLLLLGPTGAAPASESAGFSAAPPRGVVVFDLHDPDLATAWPEFLATTPMQNAEPLPAFLRERMANLVTLYRSLTPADEPAFFVASYFDVLGEALLAGESGRPSAIRPQQVCPVFVGSQRAPVSRLLAVASGLPEAVFVNAPGGADRYRYLFLQTEYSHCRVLATIGAAGADTPGPVVPSGANAGVAYLTVPVGPRAYTARVGNAEELRALLETIGDVDAISRFRHTAGMHAADDEPDVLAFVRLLALLGTDSRNGYAAVPVLMPLLGGSDEAVSGAEPAVLRVDEAMESAYRARAVFRELVPFSIRDTDELMSAQLAVRQALLERDDPRIADAALRRLLERFVAGADLLLVPTLAQQKMPPVSD